MSKFRNVKLLNSQIVYNKHGRKVVEDTIEFADGSEHQWIYFKDGSAVGVAAFTRDNKMVLTRQYRHPFGKIVLNLPGGAAEEGETLLEAVKREFEEETGFTAKKLEWIGSYSPGPNSQVVVELFFTEDIEPKGKFDQNEIVKVELIDFKKLLKRVLKDECFDSALTIAVMLVALKKFIQS
jgi:ADP-ribose pyrophosphatase